MKNTIYAVLASMVLASSGCGPNQAILESVNQKSTPSANVSIERSSMEQDLEAMRNAQFSVVFVLRRKDGGEFDADDRTVVRTNTSQANRRVAADDGRAIIVGSNFPIPPENMKPLQERFLIHDHSPPAETADSNVGN
jgi:hypothetical protein